VNVAGIGCPRRYIYTHVVARACTDLADATVLALDAGTSSLKAGLFNVNGMLIAAASTPNRATVPRPGWQEQDPEATWRAALTVLGRIHSEAPEGIAAVRAIALTGARGSFFIRGADGAARTPILTWQDRRGEAATRALTAQIDPVDYRRTTGSHLDDTMALPKLRWLMEQAGSPLEEPGATVVTPQGHIATRLGVDGSTTDWSSAAHLGVFDVRALRYDPALATAFEIDPARLPIPVEPGSAVGVVSQEGAASTHLLPGIPIILAGADGICAELGGGVVDIGQIYAYVGSGLALASPTDGFPDAVPDGLLVAPGSIAGRMRLLALGLAGASVLDWYERATGTTILDRIEMLAEASPPGAAGVFFIPALAGAGAPFWSPAAAGAILGLTFATSTSELVRAMLEGIAFQLRWMLEAVSGVVGRVMDLHLTGGGARSEAWSQIIADTLQLPVARTMEADPGLRGAACYAMAAIGADENAVAAARRIIVPRRLLDPAPESPLPRRADLYRRFREVFIDQGLDVAIHHGSLDAESFGGRST
jgi:sugar (pentulose or hexulose) kinase